VLASLTVVRYRFARDRTFARPRRRNREALGMLRVTLGLVAFVLIAYFGVTALCGYELGRQINHAKTNPLIAIGSQMIGREETEAYAIHKANFPKWITESPSFWAMLRQSE
jgi:hypothetical protein